MKKTIAMKCSQEQFDAIKNKLVGCKVTRISNFGTKSYLVNNLNNEENVITNLFSLDVFNLRAKIYETWNEKIFLEACGIETEKIFKGNEFQYWDNIQDKWRDCYGYKYRVKPNNSAEIEALEKQKLKIDKQIEKLR